MGATRVQNDTTEPQWGWEARSIQKSHQWTPESHGGASLGFQNGSAGIHERMFAGRAMAQGKFISYLRVSTDKQDRVDLASKRSMSRHKLP
jgi:hypothetical protein